MHTNLEENELLTADCHPITVAPGLTGCFWITAPAQTAARPFYASLARRMRAGRRGRRFPRIGRSWCGCWREQNRRCHRLAPRRWRLCSGGAGVVVTGQQVGLFGGPLFTPFKAATALARARQATAAGRPHAAIFWLATEDHDFAEINHVVFPARRELRKLVYRRTPEAARPVGGVVLDESITPLVEQAWELLGDSRRDGGAGRGLPAGTHAWRRRLRSFIARLLPRRGCWCWMRADGRFIAWARRCCARRLERADELHAALVERNKALEAAGYHAQVAVAAQSSLLFLIDEQTGARVALKRLPPSAQEPDGFVAGGTAELFDGGFAGDSGGRAGADLAFGAAAAGVSGFSAFDFGDRGRAGGDCLLCAVGGAVRADSGTA